MRDGNYAHKRKLMSLNRWKMTDLKGLPSSKQNAHLTCSRKISKLKRS